MLGLMVTSSAMSSTKCVTEEATGQTTRHPATNHVAVQTAERLSSGQRSAKSGSSRKFVVIEWI